MTVDDVRFVVFGFFLGCSVTSFFAWRSMVKIQRLAEELRDSIAKAMPQPEAASYSQAQGGFHG